ncbi:uncharacterized protein LDX57_006511 [Aspergillus melleus]|uniref:uncharacterized protein n=1 Tax=Aspergillus melleus TaxID=138277 RepID=UPI001E8E26C6|nr:uncharacterized protein LDX57_006511 [Aspergillus melleus]KAH8428832.1 hypothetical protein LDX57_006511 [Aspergillus melleus]
MEELDTIATQKSWAQGSLQKPFTSIVTLYMHEQLSLEQAVREITNVIKNIYYADGDVDSYLLDLWLTTLHTSKKLPRPTTTPPDQPTPLQSRLLTLLETLRRQTNPIPRPHLDSQNPIPDDPFATPTRSATSSRTQLVEDSEAVVGLGQGDVGRQEQQFDNYTSPYNNNNNYGYGYGYGYRYNDNDNDSDRYPPGERGGGTGNRNGKQKRIIWSQLPRFLDGVRIALHDEPGRPSTGFAELEVRAWEDLVAFLALCARHQIVPDPVPGSGSGSEDFGSAAEGRNVNGDRNGNGNGMDQEGEGTGGLDAVAVRMLKGALEDHQHHNHEGTTSKILNKIKKPHKKQDQQAAEEEAVRKESAQITEAVKLNVYVAAAALWAVIMGEELWERQGQKVESPVGLSLEPVPQVPAGKISKPRWRMWIDRFQFMSLREDLRISTRELAAEAAAVMLRVV